jgi:hypothetical protein
MGGDSTAVFRLIVQNLKDCRDIPGNNPRALSCEILKQRREIVSETLVRH